MNITNDILIQSIESSNLAHTISLIENAGLPLDYVNQAFLDQTGYSRDDVIGRNCRFLQGEGTDPVAIQKIRDSIKFHTPLDIEILNYKKDGSPFWNHLRMAPVFDENQKPVAFIGIQSDVTHIREQQRKESERQKLEALGRMSANISHEIKNAIQPVKLMSEILLDRNSMNDDQISKCIQIIHENINVADSVIQDTLRFSRKDNDSPEEIGALNLAKNITMFTRNLINSRIEFSSETGAFDTLSVLNVNQNHLFQVVLNIVNNALYAMNKLGQLDLEIHPEHIDSKQALILGIAQGSYMCISFKDSGCGVDKQILDTIFDPFFSTKSPGEGTGLGLSISYQIVKEMGGTIQVHSYENKGSIFSIFLPLVK